MSREDYLLAVVEKIKTIAPDDANPQIRVSCGLPSRGAFSEKSRRIGECWSSERSKDATHEIFVSPTISDSVLVIATLIHEYCHALAGIDAKHGKAFKHLAIHFGLEGKMTATTSSDYLNTTINQWIEELGAYPHANLEGKQTCGKKEGTRLIKIVCGNGACGFVGRTTRKWLDEVGLPVCACGSEFIESI